jgi:hypothetical protein
MASRLKYIKEFLIKGQPVPDGKHKLINTSVAGGTIRLNSTTKTDTTDDFIGFQSKPGLGVTTTKSVTGAEISPRVNNTFGAANVIGLHVDTYLRGTGTGTISGDVRGQQIEMVTDDNGGKTVSGNVIGLRFRTAWSGTISGKMIAIRIEKPEAQTGSKNYDYVFDLTGDNALIWCDDYTTEVTTLSGALKVRVNGADRWIPLYSGAPVV